MLFLRVTKYYSTSSIYNSLLNPNKLCSTFRFSVMLTPIKIPYNLFSPMQDEKYLLFLKSRTLPCILLLASISWSPSPPAPNPSQHQSLFQCHSVTSDPWLFPPGSYSIISSEMFSTSPNKNVVAISWEPTSVPYTHHTYWWSGLSTSCRRWVMSDSCDPMDCNPPGSSVTGFSRQEYWSGLPFPSPGNLSNPGIEPALQAESLRSETSGKQIMRTSSK